MEQRKQVEELEQKLKSHREKLIVVENSLLEKPDDQVLCKLVSDLKQVIELTDNLYQMKLEKLENVAAKASVSRSSFKKTISESKSCKWNVGDICMSKWSDNQWYIGRITSIDTSIGPEPSYHIVYLEYGNSWDVSSYELKPFRYPSSELLVPSCKCKAIYRIDGFMYDAEIISVNDNEEGTVRIKYTSAGIEDHVPIDYILVVYKSTHTDEESDENPGKAAAGDTFEIPSHLKILSTDSEADKIVKKKKIKSLKSKHRVKVKESVQSEKQNAWLSFKNNIGSKRKVGFSSSSMNKKSMFSSPDTIDGKVGVIGSGKPMTEYTSMGKLKSKNSK